LQNRSGLKEMIETTQFYDDLVPYYHLIFENWDASMTQQDEALTGLIKRELKLEQSMPINARILDAACGIGTQTLPLAARGFRVGARDLSPKAVARLEREADARRLKIDAAVADMRRVKASVSGEFDIVLVFDNSLAHLLTDDDLRIAFQEFVAVLRPGGVFLCSVRDYDKVQRGESASHVYGPRQSGGETFHVKLEWSWDDPMHYEATFIIDKETASGLTRELRTVSRFYAVSIARLLELMSQAVFQDCRRVDEIIYQPILTGRKAASTPD
jgi:SAM-dependent methyltransferase